MVGRDLDLIKLKNEVDALFEKEGQPQRYDV